MLVAAARLASFEDAVASIVRIEVPAGVLADVYEPAVPADAGDPDATGKPVDADPDQADKQIGRASCRERV